MTKREQYELIFQKRPIEGFGMSYSISQKIPGGDNSVLTHIGRLGQFETESFINDIEQSINQGSNIDVGYFSDSVEHISIAYEYPNINMEDILTISMSDMKELLKEWLSFIS